MHFYENGIIVKSILSIIKYHIYQHELLANAGYLRQEEGAGEGVEDEVERKSKVGRLSELRKGKGKTGISASNWDGGSGEKSDKNIDKLEKKVMEKVVGIIEIFMAKM